MTSITERQEQLKQQVTAALGDLVDLVTLDGVGIKPSTRAAVMIPPPTIEFTGWDLRDTTWKLIVAAGPPTAPLVALAAIDKIITRLVAEQFNLARGEPITLDLVGAGGGSLPAFELTLNPE